DLLAELNQEGYRIAIVSNKLQAGVNMMYNRHYASFVHVAIGEHNGVRRKPAPDMIYEAITLLGVKKEECIYLGDSDVDIRTAQASGLPCISVLWGFRDKQFLLAHGATTLAQAPTDILDILHSNKPLPILQP
ncbi:MAG: HAD family hydrolase, partial [Bacteroidaceae bacterium]